MQDAGGDIVEVAVYNVPGAGWEATERLFYKGRTGFNSLRVSQNLDKAHSGNLEQVLITGFQLVPKDNLKCVWHSRTRLVGTHLVSTYLG